MNSMFNLRNDIGRIIGLLLLCSSGLHFSWLPVSAAEESFTKTSKQNQPLQGAVSIDVSKKTDTLDPVLWPGNYFNKEAATALLNDQARSASIWVKIPAWQAGNWENTQATCTKAVEYKDGQAMEDEPRGIYECKGAFTIGWQRDRNGDVWNRYDTGYWTETDYDDYKAFSYIKSNGPGEADFPDSMNESIVFSVDKLTNKITDVSQEKAWERFLPIAPGIMKEEAVHTVFDEHGNPKGTAWNTALLKRTATIGQYENTASSEKFTNSQIRQDFITFLQHNGLGSLVPPESANDQVISLLDSGSAWLNKNSYARAIVDFEKALQMDPHNEIAREFLISSYGTRGAKRACASDYNGAISDLAKVQRLDKAHKFQYYLKTLALVYAARATDKENHNDNTGALTDYDRSINAKPFIDVLLKRANLRKKFGDQTGAIADYSKALKIDPLCKSAQIALEKANGTVTKN